MPSKTHRRVNSSNTDGNLTVVAEQVRQLHTESPQVAVKSAEEEEYSCSPVIGPAEGWTELDDTGRRETCTLTISIATLKISIATTTKCSQANP